MPLSKTYITRKKIHTRAIECQSFRRSDGLWDIEGHLTDVKAYSFINEYRGTIKPGEPLHDMWIRLTVDKKFIVREVEVVTDAGPYELCPTILPSFQKIKGLKIGPGWNYQIKKNLGGSKGCAHLVDMLRPIATVAFHTVRWSDSSPANTNQKPEKISRPPINTCHVWASDGDKIREEYPAFYKTCEPD